MCYVAFLRQPCNKAQGHCTVIMRQSCYIHVSENSYTTRKNTLHVLQQPCVPCSSLAAVLHALQQSCVLIRLHMKHKENEHVQNIVFVLAAASQPCDTIKQSCSVAHNTVRLRQETQEFVVEERQAYCCSILVRLM